MKYYYELTRYPKIFKDTYWGSFEENKCTNHPNDEIIKNRNEFIERNEIVCVKKLPSNTKRYNVDHSESYEDKYGRIVHVYSQHPMSWREKLPMYKIIPPIYALDQETRLLKIETTKSKKILMKQVYRNLPDDVVNIINSFLSKRR